jgi:hypothetical protein
MASALKVRNVRPSSTVYKSLTTPSANIIRRQRVEYYPRTQNEFSETNELITFNIASAVDMIEFAKSYFTFDFVVTTTKATNVAAAIDGMYLSKIGVHGLFKSIRIRDMLTGKDLVRDEYYNRRYGIMSMFNLSMEETYEMGYMSKQDLSSSGVTVAQPNRGNLTLQFPNTKIAVEATSITPKTTTYKVVWKPQHEFFQLIWPLFLSKNGIEIVLELERAARVFSLANDGIPANYASVDSQWSATYVIRNPRFYGELFTMDTNSIAAWKEQYSSEDGVQFKIRQYKVIRTPLESGSNQINEQMQFGVKSALRVFAVIMDQELSENLNNTAKFGDSLCSFLRSNISKYQFKVGSNNYPEQALDLGSVEDVEALEMFHQAYSVLSETGRLNFWPKAEWQNDTYPYWNQGDAAAVHDSHAFVMCANLARVVNGFLCGQDLQPVPLQLSASRGATGKNSHSVTWTQAGNKPVLYTFVEYDSAVVLQKNGHLEIE